MAAVRTRSGEKERGTSARSGFDRDMTVRKLRGLLPFVAAADHDSNISLQMFNVFREQKHARTAYNAARAFERVLKTGSEWPVLL